MLHGPPDATGRPIPHPVGLPSIRCSTWYAPLCTGAYGLCAPPELECVIVHLAETVGHQVEQIVLIQFPGPARALMWQGVEGALHVAGGQVHHWLFNDRG